MKIRIGTRGSDLALWQARHVAARLQSEAGVVCEIVVLSTRGDRIDDVPLQSVEGKGFFTAEIERALLRKEVDLAVHSHKDLATEGPPELVVAAVPQRAAAHERLLVRPASFAPDAARLPLAPDARVGTSAPRRQEQLRALRPDLRILDLRGNVPTRVARLVEGRYDAIVLAAAGLERLKLDLSGLEAVDLALDAFVPAPAQGALAIQVRAGDRALIELCQRRLHDEDSARAIAAERDLLVAIGGGCNLPLGVHVARRVPAAGAPHPRPPTHPGGSHGAGAGFTPSAENGTPEAPFVAYAFLGSDCPLPGHPARWLARRAATPAAAVARVHEALSAPAASASSIGARDSSAPVDGGTARGAADDENDGEGPLAALTVALVGASDAGSQLAAQLRAQGARVVHERALECEALPAADEVRERAATLRAGDVLAVTSRRAAGALMGLSLAPGVVVAAVGPTTALALAQAGLTVARVGTGGARELAAQLDLRSGTRVLFPCAEGARDDLERAARERGARVERVSVYRTRALADLRLHPGAHARVYLSPSAVEAARECEARGEGRGARRLALGQSTSEALRAAGLEHECPAAGSNDGRALGAELLEALNALARLVHTCSPAHERP